MTVRVSTPSDVPGSTCEHVLHAIDLLFERRRHGLGDNGGWRLDRPHGPPRMAARLRIFGDRKCAQTEEAGDEDEDRKHAGKDRAIDEKREKFI